MSTPHFTTGTRELRLYSGPKRYRNGYYVTYQATAKQVNEIRWAYRSLRRDGLPPSSARMYITVLIVNAPRFTGTFTIPAAANSPSGAGDAPVELEPSRHGRAPGASTLPRCLP